MPTWEKLHVKNLNIEPINKIKHDVFYCITNKMAVMLNV